VLLPAPSATGISARRLAQQSVPTPLCRAARVLLDMACPACR
jgi:hypothetical protein